MKSAQKPEQESRNLRVKRVEEMGASYRQVQRPLERREVAFRLRSDT